MTRKELERAIKAQNPELTKSEILQLIDDANADFHDRMESELSVDEAMEGFCADWFGLEQMYLEYFTTEWER